MTLLDATELADLLERTPRPVVLDVRWQLDRPDGRADFETGHIPGAVFVALDTELAGHGDPADGRHPLPTVEALQASARAWGIDDDSTVVVYDDSANLASARAWWLLRYAGVEKVLLLDGALSAWREAGLPIETGTQDPDANHREQGRVTLDYGRLPVLDIDDAASYPSRGTLVDSRAAARYRGETEPVDPRAGHIPGAINIPTADNVDSSGRFLAPEELRRRFDEAGVDASAPVGVYCGSGVTAAHNAVAMSLAGLTPAVFPGSWSAWSNSSGRGVATGATP